MQEDCYLHFIFGEDSFIRTTWKYINWEIFSVYIFYNFTNFTICKTRFFSYFQSSSFRIDVKKWNWYILKQGKEKNWSRAPFPKMCSWDDYRYIHGHYLEKLSPSSKEVAKHQVQPTFLSQRFNKLSALVPSGTYNIKNLPQFFDMGLCL